MIDLKKSMLPQAVEVGGSFYKIHTEFTYILIFREMLSDKTAPLTAFDFMYINEIPPSRLEGINAIYNFMNPPKMLPRKTGEESGEIVVDYNEDAPYIYAAFMEQYNIDLIDNPIHWHKFLALFHGLHDTELNRIISCRLYKPNGKNDAYEKHKLKQYEAWRLPQPEDTEPDEARDEFLNQIK